ncbi:MAG TPA: hypothetical protein VK391_02865 [Allosphingosinicella sp.]|jgi:hypothetical protein|nr:hypothetical protein [Allosphingosinicella sp.]
MTLLKSAIAVAAIGLLAAQPCAAATGSAAWSDGRMSAFAGANVRLPLGGAKAARPSARLQLTTSYNVRDARTGAVQSFRAQGLEFGATGNGAPTFYMNGQSTAQMQKKLQLSGSTKNTVLIIFGVALVAVTVLVLVASDEAALPGPIV